MAATKECKPKGNLPKHGQPHEYKCIGIDFYSHGCFEPSSKNWWTTSMKAFVAILRKEIIVVVTCH